MNSHKINKWDASQIFWNLAQFIKDGEAAEQVSTTEQVDVVTDKSVHGLGKNVKDIVLFWK